MLTSELKVKTERKGSVSIVRLDGTVDKNTVFDLQKILIPLTEDLSLQVILLDLTNVRYVNSTGLGLFLNAATNMRDKKERLAAFNLRPEVRLSFDMLGLTSAIQVFTTEEEAFKVFKDAQINIEEDMPKEEQKKSPIQGSDSEEKKMLLVKVVEGYHTGLLQTLDPEGEIIIGRGIQSHLFLPRDNRISRNHCKIYGRKGNFYIEDMNSSNGTYIGSMKIEGATQLNDKDRLLLGSTIVEVSYINQDIAKKIAFLKRRIPSTVSKKEQDLGETQLLTTIPEDENPSTLSKEHELLNLGQDYELVELDEHMSPRATTIVNLSGVDTQMVNVPQEIIGDHLTDNFQDEISPDQLTNDQDEVLSEPLTDNFQDEILPEQLADEVPPESLTDNFQDEVPLEELTDNFQDEILPEQLADNFQDEISPEQLDDQDEIPPEPLTDNFQDEVICEALTNEEKDKEELEAIPVGTEDIDVVVSSEPKTPQLIPNTSETQDGLWKIGAILKENYRIEEFLSKEETIYLYKGKDIKDNHAVLISGDANFIPVPPLTHPSIASVLDQGEENNLKFRIFPMIGKYLPEVIPLSEIGSLILGLAMADSLLYLHRRGISGLSLNPLFIRIDEKGVPTLLPTFISSSNQNSDLDPREADLFNLGCLLFEVSIGSSIFSNSTDKTSHESWREILFNSSLSGGFQRILARLLEKHTSWRYPQLEKLIEDLKDAMLSILTPEFSEKSITSFSVSLIEKALIWSIPNKPAIAIPWNESLMEEIKIKIASLSHIKEARLFGTHLYEQFFPSSIRELLSGTETNSLLFSLDQKLQEVPWELAYDGEKFIWEKYSISRSGGQPRPHKFFLQRPIHMLCIAGDPEYTQPCQSIAKHLAEKITGLKIVVWTGGKLTALLERIASADLVHFMGTANLEYEHLQQSKWLLPGDKSLYIYQFQNFKTCPSLVFSQVKMTPPDANVFGWALSKSGVGFSIVLMRPLEKIDMILDFYSRLLSGEDVDHALKESRKKNATENSLDCISPVIFGKTGRGIISINAP